MIREAWGGVRSMTPHFVDWPEGRTGGKALCGKDIDRVQLFPYGSAAAVHVAVCATCKRRLAKRQEKARPTAPVVPIGAGKRNRRTR